MSKERDNKIVLGILTVLLVGGLAVLVSQWSELASGARRVGLGEEGDTRAPGESVEQFIAGARERVAQGERERQQRARMGYDFRRVAVDPSTVGQAHVCVVGPGGSGTISRARAPEFVGRVMLGCLSPAEPVIGTYVQASFRETHREEVLGLVEGDTVSLRVRGATEYFAEAEYEGRQ